MKEIKLDTLTIVDIEYSEDLLGFILTLSDERIVQIQFEVETNKIHADYDKYYAVIDKINEYDLNLTDDEEEEILDFIRTNSEILGKAEELDYIREQEREEFYIKHREI